RPALLDNKAIVCDRFTDSTYAYQGKGEGYSLEDIRMLEVMTHGDIHPDLTLIFDLPVEESLRRLSLTDKDPDKFERRSKEYFQRVRDGYLERARAEPRRIKIIDSLVSIEEVQNQVLNEVRTFIDN